jgi:hypothetical protein
MNNRKKNTEDPLRNFIAPEIIEKAPDGFTARVMTAIQKEKVPVRKSTWFSRRNIVPAVSASVVMVLILLTFLLPGTRNDSLLSPALDIFKRFSASIPEYDISSFLSFEIPPTLIYVLIGILILSLLDRALNVVFHREK